MRRVQLIELHDQSWFPAPWRDMVTDALQFGINITKSYGAAVPLLQKALNASHSTAIVDLCSGAGGPWVELSRRLKEIFPNLQILLTDFYPNQSAFETIGAASEHRLSYCANPVDVMQVPAGLRGFRTMFTSFHHFRPDEARAILQNAVDAGEGIAVFESTRRSFVTAIMISAFVFLLFIGAPWIRPFRWSRLFWTFLIPVIPLALWFDGMMSCLRSYRPWELHELVASLTTNNYAWEINETKGKSPVTYLIGYPRENR